MGITFSTNLPRSCVEAPESPCNCAQLSDAWIRMLRGEDSAGIRAELAQAADPGCVFCQGKGVERYTLSSDHTHRLEIGLNAFRVLAALGLPSEPYGSCTIPEARRGLLRAHNTELGHLVRQAETGYGAPCASADGTVELRPIRQIMAGLSLDGLRDRIAGFEAFVNAAAAAGATENLLELSAPRIKPKP